MRSRTEVKVADEVWIATALLHRKYPARPDFTIEEIVETARSQGISTKHRPGVYVHALQHCVAIFWATNLLITRLRGCGRGRTVYYQ